MFNNHQHQKKPPSTLTQTPPLNEPVFLLAESNCIWALFTLCPIVRSHHYVLYLFSLKLSLDF
uniref:Uncharacterized protein n=1 Tax=Macaca nemestrina TaxID=9545 RepID=A0A2K6AXX2_MACNE